jgi:hypothetical protein
LGAHGSGDASTTDQRARMTIHEDVEKRTRRRLRELTTATVVPPDGLTISGIPPLTTGRWTIRRKAEVVAAVEGGLLTFDEACGMYSLSGEELTSWQRAVYWSGMPGLRVTRIQEYRHFYKRDQDASRKSDLGVRRFLAALSS